MSRLKTKPTKWSVRPAKTQISLGIRPVWSESSLCAQWVANDTSFFHADSEDSDQIGLMPRLIWVFAGRTCYFVRFVMRWLIFSISLFFAKIYFLLQWWHTDYIEITRKKMSLIQGKIVHCLGSIVDRCTMNCAFDLWSHETRIYLSTSDGRTLSVTGRVNRLGGLSPPRIDRLSMTIIVLTVP